MQRILLSTTAAVLVAALAAPAIAADIRRPPPRREVVAPPPALFDWTGFYLGVNGGWGWGRSRYDFVGSGLGTTGSFGLDGGLFGATLGYNFQTGPAVFGLEGDLNWADIGGNTFCALGACSTQLRWLGTARARIGYAFNNILPYVTGGAAFGNLRASTAFGSATETRVGWTLGAGVEVALNRNWSLKAEYLHVDLGKFDCGPACGALPPTNVHFNTDIIRAGANFRF